MTTEEKSIAQRGNTSLMPAPPVESSWYSVPAADMYETNEAYVVMLDVPGASRETMKLRLEQGTLDITAPVDRAAANGATVIHSERIGAGYARAFTLGEGINTDNIDARFENGVLTLKLFKAERAKPRDISIR